MYCYLVSIHNPDPDKIKITDFKEKACFFTEAKNYNLPREFTCNNGVVIKKIAYVGKVKDGFIKDKTIEKNLIKNWMPIGRVKNLWFTNMMKAKEALSK